VIRQIINVIIPCVLFVGLTLPAWAQSCQTVASQEAMSNSFLQYLEDQVQVKKDKIVILPFFDNNLSQQDSVMYHGIPFLIYEMFSSKNPNVVHPYLSFAAINSLAVVGEKLIDPEVIKQVAKTMNAHFVVFGAYQYSENKTMRVMINLYDAKKTEFLDTALSFDTDVNDAFFDLLRATVFDAFKKLSSHFALRSDDYQAPSLQAFRFYAQGLPLAMRYDQANLELAAVYFEKALKENFQKYDDAALALARAHFMMALIQKLNGGDFTLHWTQAKQALGFITQKFSKQPVKYTLTYRYIEAQNLAAQALTAFVVKNFKRAHLHALSGLELLPEDGLLQNIFMTTLEKGEPKKNIVINNPMCF